MNSNMQNLIASPQSSQFLSVGKSTDYSNLKKFKSKKPSRNLLIDEAGHNRILSAQTTMD